MDPRLLDHYHGTQRPPVFLAGRPATRTKRPLWPLIVYGALCAFGIIMCAAQLLTHL